MPRILTSLLLVALLCPVLTAPSLFAQTEGVGLGASIGVTNGAPTYDRNPIGLNVKGWISERQAISGMTSFFVGGTAVTAPSYWVVQGDYLFHNFNQLDVGEGYLALYLGAGAQMTIFEETPPNQFSLRAPMGINYLLGSAPIDVFVEVAPSLRVTDPASLRFDGAIGFRYFLTSGSGTSE